MEVCIYEMCAGWQLVGTFYFEISEVGIGSRVSQLFLSCCERNRLTRELCQMVIFLPFIALAMLLLCEDLFFFFWLVLLQFGMHRYFRHKVKIKTPSCALAQFHYKSKTEQEISIASLYTVLYKVTPV